LVGALYARIWTRPGKCRAIDCHRRSGI
jgi:hypothetical protein